MFMAGEKVSFVAFRGIYTIRRLIEEIGARYFESTLFRAFCAVTYVTPESYPDVLSHVPDNTGLKGSRGKVELCRQRAIDTLYGAPGYNR